jgi:DNA modification methylase
LSIEAEDFGTDSAEEKFPKSAAPQSKRNWTKSFANQLASGLRSVWWVIELILQAIPAARQEAARHYGMHPYFTRRPANVVRDYIERYSQDGNVFLDPFDGAGVPAIDCIPGAV